MKFLNNRYYDPTTDSFLSVDPDVQATDQPYAFVNDDPLNLSDPAGLRPYSGLGQSNTETQAIAKALTLYEASLNATAAKSAAAKAAAASTVAAKTTSLAQSKAAASIALSAAQAAQKDSVLASSYLTQSSNITLNVFSLPTSTGKLWNYASEAASSASAAESSATSAEISASSYGNPTTHILDVLGNAILGCVVFAGAAVIASGGVALAGGPVAVGVACGQGGLAAVGAG